MADASILGLAEHCRPLCNHQRSYKGHQTFLGARLQNRAVRSICRRASVWTAVHHLASQQVSGLADSLCQSDYLCGKFLQNIESWRRKWHGHRGSVVVQSVQAIERPSPPASATQNGSSLQDLVKGMEDVALPRYDQSVGKVELVVAGAGPSGLAVAERVSKAGG